jgi:transposase
MSRRAIARITSIPKETVRRHVASMIGRGILLSTPQGVRAPNRLAERKALAAILELLELHAACTEQLGKLQAIVARPEPPPVGNRTGTARRG